MSYYSAKYGGYVQLSTLLLQHPVRKLDKQQQMQRVRSYSEVIMHVNGDRVRTIEKKILKVGRVLLWNLGRMANLFWFVIEDHIMEFICQLIKEKDIGIQGSGRKQVDKRSRVDVVRYICWIDGKRHVADALTKRGAFTGMLMEVSTQGFCWQSPRRAGI